MKPSRYNSSPDRIHQAVKEVVRIGLESQLREPILEAVEEAGGEPGYQSTNERTQDETAIPKKSQITMIVQGLAVFIVMFVTLYVILQKLTSGENQ